MTDHSARPPRGRPLVAITALLAGVLLLAPQPARGEPLALPIVSALPLPSILPSPLQSTLTEVISPVASLIAPVQSILPLPTLPPVVPTLPPVVPTATLPPIVPTLPPVVPTATLPPIVPTLPPVVPTATLPPIVPTLPPVVPTATLPPIVPTLPPVVPTATLPPVLPTTSLPLPTGTVPLPTIVASGGSTPSPSTPAPTVAGANATLIAGPAVVVPPGDPPAAPFPAIGGPLGDLVRLLGDVSVPALTAGVPTLLVIAFIAAQVLGGAAWTTLVRRGLGSWGLRVLRPAGTPDEVGGTPRDG
jgi:hypothetical protein